MSMRYTPENRPYTIHRIWPILDIVDGNGRVTTASRSGSTDITPHLYMIEKMTDSDQDSPQSAQMTLNTIDGAFVTDHSGHATPIITQYDEIEVELTDDAGRKFRRIMVVDETMPDETEAGGHLTKYQLYGREYYLKQVRMSGHDFFTTHRNMITRIIDLYNESKGESQPTIQLEMTDVPAYPVNIWRWGEATSAFDALSRVIDGLALPVKAGGASEYFTMRFTEKASDPPVSADKSICLLYTSPSPRD